MKARASVTSEAKRLEIVEVDQGPKSAEVLVEVKAIGVCHADAYMLHGFDSEGVFLSGMRMASRRCPEGVKGFQNMPCSDGMKIIFDVMNAYAHREHDHPAGMPGRSMRHA